MTLVSRKMRETSQPEAAWGGLRWEYRTVDQVDRKTTEEIETLFNQLGAQGWELSAMVEYGAAHRARAVFKRAL